MVSFQRSDASGAGALGVTAAGASLRSVGGGAGSAGWFLDLAIPVEGAVGGRLRPKTTPPSPPLVTVVICDWNAWPVLASAVAET